MHTYSRTHIIFLIFIKKLSDIENIFVGNTGRRTNLFLSHNFQRTIRITPAHSHSIRAFASVKEMIRKGQRLKMDFGSGLLVILVVKR